ncbi:hypothetical protein [Schaalia hyovaginalis]|uniref:hypothetical protein n=1 Tax=Schaalia hyovaginalis TaxID=29316 RepID=UPI001C881BD6|nr:hypothetical protein [Schaalia hyovaginalis]
MVEVSGGAAAGALLPSAAIIPAVLLGVGVGVGTSYVSEWVYEKSVPLKIRGKIDRGVRELLH